MTIKNNLMEDQIMIIVITGTPGTGKTSISRRLSEIIRADYVNLTDVALRNNLVTDYDGERATYIIDEKHLSTFITKYLKENRLKKNIIIDTHYPEILPSELIDMVFVLRLRPDVLLERLTERKWDKRKIEENVEAELLNIISISAHRHFSVGKVFDVDITGLDLDDITNMLLDYILYRKENPYIKTTSINWLDYPDILKFIQLYKKRLF